MTPEERAQQIVATWYRGPYQIHSYDEQIATIEITDIAAAIATAVEEERMRCARICDSISDSLHAQYKGAPPYETNNPNRADPHTEGMSDGAALCAVSIRAQL